jgi:flagella basal body P-ring formation protein FlgA
MSAQPALTAAAFALLAIATAAPLSPAAAQDAAARETGTRETGAPTLRPGVVVESGLVTLGDLFENAGAVATTPVFRAPDPGETGHVSTARIAEAAQRHGLEWRNDDAIAKVAVRRDSTRIGLEDIREKIAGEMRTRLSLSPEESLSLTLARTSRPLHLPVNFSGALRITHLDLAPGGGEFAAELAPADEIASTIRAVYRGTVAITLPVPVLKDSLARGETIQASMVEIHEVPRSRVPADTILRKDDIIGMAARHSLQSGRALRAEDIEAPRLVRRNSAITITYVQGALTISMHGRSLDDGARDDLVRVLNLRSNRTIEAVVTGPDQAVVVAAGPARTALLGANAPADR